MKQNLILVILITVFIGLLFFVIIKVNRNNAYAGEGLWPNYVVETKQIDGKMMRLVVADTPEHWMQGLMYVRKPTYEFDGMIFYFKTAAPHTFWNKNTFENLTLYWLNKNTVIGTSELPSIEKSKQIVTVDSPGPADTVVEFIK